MPRILPSLIVTSIAAVQKRSFDLLMGVWPAWPNALGIRLGWDVEWIGPKQKRFPVAGFQQAYAVGSGMTIAMGVMAAGASAEEAVQIAYKLDVYTRRVQTVLRVD
ncbi:hypothetical protein [Hoeflea sp.]|uniref:hypothetical protein n=1 Tax=Hoeflea sp. TaxID=1940281 RepID=UPI003B013FAD